MFLGRVHVDNEEEIVGSGTRRIIEDFIRSRYNIKTDIEDLRSSTEVVKALKQRGIKKKEIMDFLEKQNKKINNLEEDIYTITTYNLISSLDAINIKLDRIDRKINKLLNKKTNYRKKISKKRS